MHTFNELDNPYTLRFSYIPPRLIERTVVIEEIISNYVRKFPTYTGIFLTGVKGCGKTVMLNEIRGRLDKAKDWITVDLNPESNLLDSLARGLYLIPELRALFIKAKIDFSVLGIGVHVEGAELIASSEEDALLLMLRTLKTAGKKLFVTIDEVTYSKDVAKFSHALSSYSGEGIDIYVLMTGLAENIINIRNKKSLTFLYRAKVMELDTLNITAIQMDYLDTLKVERERADELAFKTRGYSLAFQALGYIYWNELSKSDKRQEVDLTKVDAELDKILSELAYDKIWDELSSTDKKILKAMARLKTDEEYIKVENIRQEINISSDSFTKYRSRLLEAGVVEGSQYGYLRFKLPRFENYVENERRM